MSRIKIELEKVLKERKISKNQLCYACKLQHTQLNNYCKNKVVRVDLATIAKICDYVGCSIADADGKISLNQQKPSKHAGLRRFGPEKFLQRNNEFMKERPIFYKKPIKTEKDFSTWLRCFYYTTKAVITEYIYF